MRSWLRWLLLLTIFTSLAASLWPDQVGNVVPQVGTIASTPPTVRQAASATGAVRELPLQLPSVSLEKAEFDPFTGVQAPLPPPLEPPPVVQASPPPPSVPPLNYRYLGRMVDPSGRQLVYLAKTGAEGTPAIEVAEGTQLEDGYVVDAIGPESIRLIFPAFGHVVIDIPAVQEAVTR